MIFSPFMAMLYLFLPVVFSANHAISRQEVKGMAKLDYVTTQIPGRPTLTPD
jgi:hypothetical protein